MHVLSIRRAGEEEKLPKEGALSAFHFALLVERGG